MAEQDDYRRKITVLGHGLKIRGEGNLPAGARITDYLNESKAFIALTNAEVWDTAAGRKLVSSPFMNVSRSCVEIVIPDE